MMSPEKKEAYSKKMRQSLIGKNTGPRSDEVKRKISETKKKMGTSRGESNPMYGKNIKDYMTEEAYLQWKINISNSLKGKKHTEETKRKISEAHKGKLVLNKTRQKLSLLNSGEKNPMYGTHHTLESKKLIAKANEKKVMVKFASNEELFFESRNKCAEYFKNNYNVSMYTIKKLLKTGEKLNSRYKKFEELNGLTICYINNR